MAQGKFISYLRVSTQKQGRSGLGLEAQRQAVTEFLNGGNWELVAEFVEVETGKATDRPELAKALAACRVHGATLVVAKLDRLARNAAFLLSLQAAGVDFICADMPQANRLTVGILAVVAEDEARRISERTKAALQAAKARGTKLGNPGNLSDEARRKGATAAARLRTEAHRQRVADLRAVVEEIRAAGVVSLRGIARELESRRVPTVRGGRWTAVQVGALLRGE